MMIINEVICIGAWLKILDMVSCYLFFFFFIYKYKDRLAGWLVVLGLKALETVFLSISGLLPKGGRKRKERIDKSKNVKTNPTRTYCKRSRPLPY